MVRIMEDKNLLKVMGNLWEKLDYWCDQYKYANDVLHDSKECARITENIQLLEKAFNSLDEAFKKELI